MRRHQFAARGRRRRPRPWIDETAPARCPLLPWQPHQQVGRDNERDAQPAEPLQALAQQEPRKNGSVRSIEAVYDGRLLWRHRCLPIHLQPACCGRHRHREIYKLHCVALKQLPRIADDTAAGLPRDSERGHPTAQSREHERRRCKMRRVLLPCATQPNDVHCRGERRTERPPKTPHPSHRSGG